MSTVDARIGSVLLDVPSYSGREKPAGRKGGRTIVYRPNGENRKLSEYETLIKAPSAGFTEITKVAGIFVSRAILDNAKQPPESIGDRLLQALRDQAD